MKGIVIKGATGIHTPNNIPAVPRGLKCLLLANQFNAATGVLADALPLNDVFQHSPFVTLGEKPVISNPTAFGSKAAISFVRETGKRKDLKGVLSLKGTKWTINFVIVNNAAIATTTNRVLFEFVTPLKDGEQKLLKFYSTGSTGFCRIITSKTAGAYVFGSQANITSVSYTLLQPSVNNTKLIFTLIGDTVAQTITIYVNGVLSQVLPVTNLTELTGDLYFGTALSVAAETSDFYGALGSFSVHNDALTAAEITAVFNSLNTAFS